MHDMSTFNTKTKSRDMQIQDNAACAFVTNVAGKDVREEGVVLKLPLHLHNSTNPVPHVSLHIKVTWPFASV